MTKTSMKVGQSAPDFCLFDQDGKRICLEDFRGKWVVLYFIREITRQGAVWRQRALVVWKRVLKPKTQ